MAHRPPITSCFQDDTPTPDRNLFYGVSVKRTEEDGGRVSRIPRSWPPIFSRFQDDTPAPDRNLFLRCVRETEEDGGRVRRMEGDEEGSREKLFWGVSVRLSKFAFLNPFTF